MCEESHDTNDEESHDTNKLLIIEQVENMK